MNEEPPKDPEPSMPADVMDVMNTSVGNAPKGKRVRAILEFKAGVSMQEVQQVVLEVALQFDDKLADVRFEFIGQFK